MTASVLFLALLAQHAHHPASQEKPVQLLSGMGKHTRPIGASNADAQKFFDQGLNLLYGFNRHEAWRSFAKASELDPKNPMPKWGMAMARGPYINMDLDGSSDIKYYCETLSGVPGSWAKAASTRCPDGSDDRYIAAMKDFVASNPDDLDAATFYAEALMIPVRWQWFSKDGAAAKGTDEAIAVLEGVLRRNPDHPGANHFYIHAVESSPTPERAIPSAQRLMGLVPNAGHLVHMPGHIWLVVGDYETSANTNDRAAELDRRYFEETNVQGAYQMYYAHNVHFIAASRQMQGRKADTLKAALELEKIAAPFAAAMPDMADPFVPYRWFMLERFQQWDDILAVPKPDGTLLTSNALWHWARALALHEKGKSPAAEVKAFEAAAKAVPADRGWMNSKASTILEIASKVLQARLVADPARAAALLKQAADAQDQLAYDEPPEWYFPVCESWGAALLRAGQPAEAEQVFRAGLKQSARNGRLLFGLWQSLKAQNKTEAASMVEREYREAWRRADVELSLDSM